MSKGTRMLKSLTIVALGLVLVACDKPEDKPKPAPSAALPALTSAAPTASVKVTPPAKPSHECPEGSEGDGTASSPCEAKGGTRTMDVEWTGKITDKGPSFRVVNNTKLEILYGILWVYFYDKDGKQLAVPSDSDTPRKRQKCGGRIFAGPMKPGEKAVLWFSCVKKKHVPEGAVAIEGEIQTVGFTAASGGKADTYWRNKDLTPEERSKGGIKADKKKTKKK